MITLSVDPGTASTGVAIWDGTTLKGVDTIKTPPQDTPYLKAIAAFDNFINAFSRLKVGVVVIERYHSYKKNKATESMLLFIGMLRGYYHAKGVKVVFVDYWEWKNVVDKPCYKNIIATLGRTNEHVRDAVGIGIHYFSGPK